MNTIGNGTHLDIEGLMNAISADAGVSAREDQKVTGSRLKVQTERIQEKRRERLDNLREQMEGAAKSGGCLKFFKAIFKVFDILTKPLSAITGGQLKLELGKIFEQLQKAKETGRLEGLKIDGQELQAALQGLKKFLQEDTQRVKETEEIHSKTDVQILNMLDEIHDSFRAGNRS